MGISRYFRKDSSDINQTEERRIISKCISTGDVVFDVGAHQGLWSTAVLAHSKQLDLHLFEASQNTFEVLASKFGEKATVNHAAVYHSNGKIDFNNYRDDDRMSSIYRRTSVEERLLPAGSNSNIVTSVALDNYWTDPKRQINFLKIDVEGAEYDVLRGANRLLKAGQIDYIQFEYGGTFEDAGFTLENVWSYLKRSGYAVFKVGKHKFTELNRFKSANENYRYTNFLAVHERLKSQFTGKPKHIELNINKMKQYGFKPKGVIHVGAHQVQELSNYRANEISPIVFVEANPVLARLLTEKVGHEKDIRIIEGAASDRVGTASFNIASTDQSSSLLRPAKHSELDPKITFDQKIEVRTITLDNAIQEAGIDPASINMLTMHAQGAELIALRGASEVLKHVEAIQIEINYDEFNEGCPHISDIDLFLAPHGFIRIKTATPNSKDRGDAVYVKAPWIINSRLGSMGRFANKGFQYIFLKTYALEHGFKFANHRWEGDDMFQVQSGSDVLPNVDRIISQAKHYLPNCNILNASEPLADADVGGYFQYNMKYYAPYRSIIQKEFAHKGEYLVAEKKMRKSFERLAGPVAVVHLRRGDYGKGIFFLTPNSWHVDWLKLLQAKEPNLQVYIASDDPTTIGSDFDQFNLITAEQLNLPPVEHAFFYDFTAMRLGDHLSISNSTFSFLASALNEVAVSIARPDPEARKMVEFEPWTSDPLIRSHRAEYLGDEFVSARVKSKAKYQVKKMYGKISRLGS